MRLICNLFSSLFPTLEGSGGQRDKEQAIDASVRFAVLGLIKASLFWLLITSLLGMIVSIKVHSPDYLNNSVFTYGKVYPAFWNVLVYGWLINGGFACIAWIFARLSGRVSGNSGVLAVSTIAWNIAVIIGLVGIFKGDQNVYRMLEFPTYAAPFLFVAFVGLGIWVLLTFKARAYRSSFAAQWYGLAGIFSFVWIYTIAQVMIFCVPAQGVFQVVVAEWFRGNLFGLVVAPFALATVYYLIPKALGQHVVGYHRAGTAFWTWIIFTSCSGLAALANGPFPAWLASFGIIASFGLFLPVTVLSMQFLGSLFSSFSKIWDTISIRFVFYGVVALLASTLLIVFGSLRGIQETVQFSQFDNGVRFLFLAGFAGMVFMGAFYYILPRLLNKELPSTGLADLQFWVQGLGIFVISAFLIGGGVVHGGLVNQSTADTIAIVTNTKSYLVITTIGSFLFLCGSLAGVVSFIWMLLAPRAAKEQSADLIESAPELEYTPS